MWYRSVYGKMKCCMNETSTYVAPAPPNLIASLRAGFDAVANQIAIILIPMAIDLFLWLGPHLRIKSLVNTFIDSFASTDLSSFQSDEVLNASVEILRTTAEQFNLVSMLRTIPVGIPSLMAARLPVEIPGGAPTFIEIGNPLGVIGIGFGMLILGLLFGVVYYFLVGEIALEGRFNFKKLIRNWSWSTLQILGLTLALLLLFIVISIPTSCIISAISLLGASLGQFVVFLYIGALLWLAFPLLFAAHGIFVHHINALASVQRSILLTRMTLSTTSLFILAVLIISEGLDLLWRVPPENSWLTLIGVGGHAFICSSLLAASFIYYRDADHWTQETIKILKAQRTMAIKNN